MRASHGLFALLITLTACSGKKRPFGDGPIEGLDGSGGSLPGISATESETDASVGAGVDPAAAGEEPPVATLARPEDTTQSSGNLACERDAGTCTTHDAGPAPAVCTPAGPRDCSSDVDNDCDGEPDNTADDICPCVVGTTEPCDEHPGLDGRGECRAGSRTCVLDAETLTTVWTECEGSVGPGDEDSCLPGDDADCDGTPNEGCSCVDGETQPCGSTTNTGPCQIGTSTCIDGQFGPCVGAVAPASADSCSSRNDDSNCNGIPFDGCSCVNDETQPCGMTDTGVCQLGTRTCAQGAFGQCVGQVNPRARDCRSAQDNDCNGQPDNTLDNVCRCAIGSTQACDQHPGLDGVGPCRAGTQTCVAGPNNSSSNFGACTGSVGPEEEDSCTVVGNDANCNGVANDGCACGPGVGATPLPAVTRGISSAPFGTPGGVLNGTYFLTDIITPPVLALWSGEIIEFRDEDGTFRRKRTAFSSSGQGNTTVESGTFRYVGNSVVLETDSVECGSGGVVMSSDGTWLYTVGGFPSLKLQAGGGLVELHYLTATGFGI